MNDYRIQIRIKNNRILELIEQMGFESVNAFCRQNELCQSMVGEFVNLKRPPLTLDGEWSRPAVRLADALCAEPDDLWTDEQRTMQLPGKWERAVSTAEVRALMDVSERPLIDYDTPEHLLLDAEAEEEEGAIIAEAINALREKQRTAIKMRFGLAPYERKHTLAEIGKELKVGNERVRQLVAGAIHKLRRSPLLVEDMRAAGERIDAGGR